MSSREILDRFQLGSPESDFCVRLSFMKSLPFSSDVHEVHLFAHVSGTTEA